MKRVFLSAMAMFAFLQSFAQKANDSTGFKGRKLQLEEANLVSSYYMQNGDHSAVTGGIGSEKLTDIANVFDVKLIRYDKKLRKHSLGIELGIDHYTSASSDKIDLKANSSASHADTRIYPSVNWNVENETRGTSFGIGLSSSSEFDYQSFGANISFSQKSKNKNGEFTAKFQTYLDQVKLVLPVELRVNPNSKDDYGTSARNTFAGSLSYSQIINKNFQAIFLADVIEQKGYLGLPFHRVYFNDGTVHQENLPDSRFKIPLGVRASYFLGDKFIIRAYYRFYTDDWGLRSHTANIEIPIKISPFLSISPFYRFYNQTAVRYFGPYQEHSVQDGYYTSNYDLSSFNSNFLGAGFRIAPRRGVFGISRLNMFELRFGHYLKNTGLNANIISMNLKFR